LTSSVRSSKGSRFSSGDDDAAVGEACAAALPLPFAVGKCAGTSLRPAVVVLVECGDSPASSDCRGRFGLRWIAEVPGAGKAQSSARPLCLHLSHGGLSSWMHFCFAERHETHATGLRIVDLMDWIWDISTRGLRAGRDRSCYLDVLRIPCLPISTLAAVSAESGNVRQISTSTLTSHLTSVHRLTFVFPPHLSSSVLFFCIARPLATIVRPFATGSHQSYAIHHEMLLVLSCCRVTNVLFPTSRACICRRRCQGSCYVGFGLYIAFIALPPATMYNFPTTISSRPEEAQGIKLGSLIRRAPTVICLLGTVRFPVGCFPFLC
jgi:hypothetical protein